MSCGNLRDDQDVYLPFKMTSLMFKTNFYNESINLHRCTVGLGLEEEEEVECEGIFLLP